MERQTTSSYGRWRTRASVIVTLPAAKTMARRRRSLAHACLLGPSGLPVRGPPLLLHSEEAPERTTPLTNTTAAITPAASGTDGDEGPTCHGDSRAPDSLSPGLLGQKYSVGRTRVDHHYQLGKALERDSRPYGPNR